MCCFRRIRNEYHQVRMKKVEEFKTTFRTHQGLYEFKLMPFGLINASAAFQSLVNLVFKPLLRKKVLVFFYDILVYSPNWTTHLQDLREVLQIMRDNQLFAKKSKCKVGHKQVHYLGHIIFQKGLQIDPKKLKAVSKWPKPNNIRALRGFLGLAGYYMKFFKDYGVISIPLTALLKKNAYQWSNEADKAFDQLKEAICTRLVLALPDFYKRFVVETDASHQSMGAVLMHEGRAIAYFSKAFGDQHLGMSIHEKEFLSIISALDKWRPYLLGRHFIIKIDHQSLKSLFDQKITTAIQQKELIKLMGLDYTIQYKKGMENRVENALSRKE